MGSWILILIVNGVMQTSSITFNDFYSCSNAGYKYTMEKGIYNDVEMYCRDSKKHPEGKGINVKKEWDKEARNLRAINSPENKCFRSLATRKFMEEPSGWCTPDMIKEFNSDPAEYRRRYGYTTAR